MQRHLTSSPFDRSFTAGSVTDEDLYALPQNARPGRLEPSIDAEGMPDPHETVGTAAGVSVDTYVDTDANTDANTDAGMNPEGNDDDDDADTSQWHHHADDLMQASMISNRRADGTQQTILHSPCSQVAFAGVDTDSGLASPNALQSEHHSLLLPYDSSSPAQIEHASTTGRMHSTFATSWLHSTGSSALSSQTSSMQPVAMKGWVSHSAQQLSNTSSSASLHELQELGPHPPAQPSTRSGLLTGRSGFTGQRGVTGDPRMRRFKDAHPSGERFA